MLEYLYKILIGHSHEYKIIDKDTRISKWDFNFSTQCTMYHLQCNTCGKMKAKLV